MAGISLGRIGPGQVQGGGCHSAWDLAQFLHGALWDCGQITWGCICEAFFWVYLKWLLVSSRVLMILRKNSYQKVQIGKEKIVANALRLQWSPSLKYQGTSCAFMWWNEWEFTLHTFNSLAASFSMPNLPTRKIGRQRFSILESLQNEYSKIGI